MDGSDNGEEVSEDENEDEQVDGITELLGKMSVGKAPTKKPFSMDVAFPYFLYEYEEADEKHCSVDFLVYGLPNSAYRPKVSPGGQELQLRVIVPPFFVSDDRLFVANDEINENTHKATAYKMAVDSIKKKHGDGSVEQRLMGDPQSVKLPFPVEEQISCWEVQAFGNNDTDFHLGGVQQMVFILAVDLVAKEKRYKKKEGGIRVFTTPTTRRRNNNTNNNRRGNDDDDYDYDDDDATHMVQD